MFRGPSSRNLMQQNSDLRPRSEATVAVESLHEIDRKHLEDSIVAGRQHAITCTWLKLEVDKLVSFYVGVLSEVQVGFGTRRIRPDIGRLNQGTVWSVANHGI